MNTETFIQKMEAAWDVDGFLYGIRNGDFEPIEGEEFLDLIKSVTLKEEEDIPRRVVSLLWFLSPFLEWQKERVAEKSEPKIISYRRFVMEVIKVLEQKLGVP